MENLSNTWYKKLILINIGAFLIANITGLTEVLSHNLDSGNYLVKLLTVFTHLFMHVDIIHLASNMIVLYFIGRKYDKIVNISEDMTMCIYLWLGLFISLFIDLILDIDVLILGASGAICGMLGILARIYPKEERRNLFKIIVLLYLIFNIYGIFTSPNGLGCFAHTFGILIGYFWIGKREKFINNEKKD